MKNRKRSAVILAILLIAFYIGFFLLFQDGQKSEKETKNDRTQETVTELDVSPSGERSDLRILAERIRSGNGERVFAYEPSALMAADIMGEYEALLESERS